MSSGKLFEFSVDFKILVDIIKLKLFVVTIKIYDRNLIEKYRKMGKFLISYFGVLIKICDKIMNIIESAVIQFLCPPLYFCITFIDISQGGKSGFFGI
jgi:hypothetical protein